MAVATRPGWKEESMAIRWDVGVPHLEGTGLENHIPANSGLPLNYMASIKQMTRRMKGLLSFIRMNVFQKRQYARKYAKAMDARLFHRVS